MTTIPQTTEQLTYYIRPGWMGGKGGCERYEAVDAETGTPLPGTDSVSEDALRWTMRLRYPWYAEKDAVTA